MDFSCDECGGCAINLPEGLDDNASVVCHRCGKALCTWAEFKERTHQVLTEGGRKLNHEPAGSQTTNGTEVDLPDKPRVLAFDPFFRPRARTEATNRSRYVPFRIYDGSE